MEPHPLRTFDHSFYFPLAAASYISYFLFVDAFTQARKRIPALHRFLQWAIRIFMVVLLVERCLYFGVSPWASWYFVNVMRIFFYAGVVYYAYLIIRHYDHLVKYILLGSLMLLIGLVLAFIASHWWSMMSSIIETADLFSLFGVLAEVMVFALGLGHLQRIAEKEKLQYQMNWQMQQRETDLVKEREAMKTRFFANVSHEFRTPLTIIQGMANQIQRNPGHWLDEGVRAIRQSCRELLRLVDQLLDFSKLEAGHLRPHLTKGDIIPCLQSLLESFQAIAQGKTITLSFESAVDQLEMDYDPNLIRHIASNLLSNSLKFTPANGKVVLRIEQRVREEKELLVLEVEDSGQGIPADQLPHIFGRYYQASSNSSEKKGGNVSSSPSGETGGAGIGLALVKEIIDVLDGKIKVESQLGIGATFTILLPITRMAPPMETYGAQFIQENALQVGMEEMNVTERPLRKDAPLLLLVEDHEGVIRYLKGLLHYRYRLETAANGREALEKASEIRPSLIISDVMMPKMDGYTFCEKIKTDRATSHIPVILLTARATHEGRKEGLRRGADAYIVKPFDPEELFIRIEQLLGLRQKLKEKYWKAARLHLSEGLDVLPKHAAFLEKLDEHIWENIDGPAFKVGQLAAAMYMSRTSLFTEVKKITGKPPSEYLRDARLELADQLIKNTGLSLSEIAEKISFSSDSYLAKVYRDKFGVSPSEVRKKSAE